MPTVKLYTVKEAARIVGVSTNTLYKYLLEDKIHAARGTHKQGRFRIPHSALEAFLGTTIPLDEPTPTMHIESDSSREMSPDAQQSGGPSETLETHNIGSVQVRKKKLIRLLLLLAHLALIIDTLINPNWTITSGLLRLLLFALLSLIIYRPRRVV